jgi:hypothetical protein
MREPVEGCGWSAEALEIIGDEGVTSFVRLTVSTEALELFVVHLDPMVALGVGVDLIRASKAEPGDWDTAEWSTDD